jgi:methylamine dehydrogenase accessory protein MauD
VWIKIAPQLSPSFIRKFVAAFRVARRITVRSFKRQLGWNRYRIRRMSFRSIPERRDINTRKAFEWDLRRLSVNIFWISCFVILWAVVLFLGFLLLGTLRSLGVLSWRLEQLEATTPKRLGRDGLKPGKKAPDFTLPSANGKEISLHDFAGRKVLLVFTQSGCSPCKAIIPELNRLGPAEQVLVVNNGDPEATGKWSTEVAARFPVLAQDKFSISKRYEVFATPFAFLIDEKGIIASKGIISSRQHIRYVLSGKRAGGHNGHADTETESAESTEPQESPSISTSKEFSHV